MNAWVPITAIIIALVTILAREMNQRRTLARFAKSEEGDSYRRTVSHKQEKLKWILAKKAEKNKDAEKKEPINKRHVGLSLQDISKQTADALKMLERALVVALSEYPGETDELLKADKESMAQAAQSKQQTMEKYKRRPRVSANQTAKAIKTEDWK